MIQGWAGRHARGPVVLALLALAGAAAASAADWRFDLDAPLVTRVPDDRPIAAPEASGWNEIENFIDDHWRWPLADLLSGRGATQAEDLNALDEVPLSSWFLGEEAQPAAADWTGAAPLQVEEARVAGDEPYLIIRDARGARFLCLLDQARRPREQTAAALIASRLLGAAGYPVFPGAIATIARGDLALAPEARAAGEFGGGGRLEAAVLDRLWGAEPRRVALFALPAGTRLGGFRERGTRADDPNDLIEHQQRRSLRGLAPLCAWLGFDRIDEAHTLDIHLDEGRFVRHHLARLGSTLGVLAPRSTNGRASGARSAAVAGAQGAPTFGLQGFDPLAWQPRRPFAPFEALGWGDLLWGVKQLLSVTPKEIEQAVQAAQLEDPGQARWLTGTLIERRERVAAAWLERINGAVDFRVQERAPGRWQLVCADLAARHGLRRPEDAFFAMRLRLPETDEVVGQQSRGGAEPAFDLTPFRPPVWAHRLDPRRYAIAEIRAWDPAGRALEGCARVHLYFDGEAGPRIVGIVRD